MYAYPDGWDAGCPLLDACVRGDHEQVCQLLSHEDELYLTDPSGKTPLHYACQFGWKDIAQFLIQKSLNPNATDEEGNTSLHIACQYGNSNIVDFILSLHDCDVNAINAMGNTPLHLACQIGSVPITMKLMTTGKIDYKFRNNIGLTALEVADESNPLKYILLSCIRKIEMPFIPMSRVYLLGSNSSGKSTLINGLRKQFEMDTVKELSDVFKRNQGIIPIPFQSPNLDHPFIICKFPGNHTFYRNGMPKYVSEPPQLFVITVDISRTDAEVERDITFWMSQIWKFFSSHTAHIILIATHPDSTRSSTLPTRLSKLSSTFKSCYCLSAQLLDTSTPEYQQLLLQFLQCISSDVPKIAYPIAVLSGLIDTEFRASKSVDITDLISCIKNNDDIPLPESKEDLDQLLYSLSHYSDIIYLPNLNSQSRIVVNVLRCLEMLLTHARLPPSPEFEASFLEHLGFQSDVAMRTSEGNFNMIFLNDVIAKV